MHSCENSDKDKDDTRNPCPENGLIISFQMLWNNGMHNEQQTANCICHASENPKVEYLCQNISQNNKNNRKNHLCYISQFHKSHSFANSSLKFILYYHN